MRIEKEGEYRNARGEKVTLVKNWCDGECWPFEDRRGTWYRFDGTSCRGSVDNMVPGDDLISEWDEGPVRTVTRQEIVPGTYDGVSVGEVCNVPDCAEPGNPARIEVFVRLSDHLDADQLDRAAAVLTALAGALRDAP